MLGIQAEVWRKIAVTAVIFVAFLRLIAGGASAQTPERTLTVTPSSGPPGTTLTVSGTDCSIVPPDPDTDGPEQVLVQLLAPDGTTVAETTTPAAPDGTWSTQITAPETTTLGAALTVSGNCQGDSSFSYGSSTFGVEAVQGPGPTTTTTSAATSPGPTPPQRTPRPADAFSAGGPSAGSSATGGSSSGSSSDGSSVGGASDTADSGTADGSSLVVPTAEPASPTDGGPDYTG
jgi:hypothetical protein